jgi:MHS family proline/betaine transporter-like MFS transporter
MGLAVVQALTFALSTEGFESYGWRIGFLLSFVIGIVGFYIKHFLEESPDFTGIEDSHKEEHHEPQISPFKEVLKNHSKELLIAIGTYLTVTVPFYTITIFMNTYMTRILGHDHQESIIINAVSVLWMTLLFPLGAWISDKVGRKPVVVFSAVAFICFTYPVFWMLNQPGWVMPLMGQMLFGTILGFYLSPIPALLVELFPVKVRFTGVAVSYNISAALFGGTTPSVAMACS